MNRLAVVLITVVGTAYFIVVVYSKVCEERVIGPADCCTLLLNCIGLLFVSLMMAFAEKVKSRVTE